jgi:hypothetical protein
MSRGKAWSDEERKTLKDLWCQGANDAVIAAALPERIGYAIRRKAHELGLRRRPKNKIGLKAESDDLREGVIKVPRNDPLLARLIANH